jgi:phenylacetate-CoA ligase
LGKRAWVTLGRAYLRLRRPDISGRFRILLENERRTGPELQAISDARLRRIIAYAYEQVPYYRTLFDHCRVSPASIRSSADLQRLPPLTKDAIRAHFDSLRATAAIPRTRQATTGGSTGEPLKFLTTASVKAWHDAAKLRFWRYAGLELGIKHALIWGCTFDLKRLQSVPARLERFLGRQLLLDAHTVSDETLERYCARLLRYRPQVIHGYAQTVYALACHLLAGGTSIPSVRSVLTAAETLYPQHRATIEQAFGCQVFNRYASRETALEVQECERHEGLHISTDTAILEVVDEEGKWVPDGSCGKLLITDVTNLAMPLIRYQIEDIGIASRASCSCGRPFPLVRSIEGRVTDQVILRDGRIIHPLFMMYLMYPEPAQDWNRGMETPVPGVRQYEIIQHDYQVFEIRIILHEGWDGTHLVYLRDNFERYLGPDISIRLSFVPAIAAGPSGKRRYVRSELGELKTRSRSADPGHNWTSV